MNYAPGEIRVYDANSDFKITAEDRVFIGYGVPKWSGSVNSNMAFKGVDLSFFISTRQGFTINDGQGGGLHFEGRYNGKKVDYWTPTNTTAKYPRPRDGRQTPLNYGTMYYQDGSYVRIRHITLGYSFDNKLLSLMRLQQLRLYVTAQNPFLFTSFDGSDPDGSTGHNSYPSIKSFLFGLNVTF